MSRLERGAFRALVLCAAAAMALTACSSGQQETPPADSGQVSDAAAPEQSTVGDTGAGASDSDAGTPGAEESGMSSSAMSEQSGAASGSAGSESGSAGSVTGPITIAQIQKQGNQQYFVDQANGAKDAGKKLGDVTVTVTDVQLDSNAAINAVNTAIAQKADGIIITVPDQKIGPQVIQLAEQAGIPLIATDDPIEDASGEPAPFVGFNSTKMGEAVGNKAAELYKAAGWSAADARILNVQKQDLSDCVDRGKGALAAFKKVVGAEIPKVIDEATDATTPQALNRTGAVITANPGVKNWVVWGCNDESETGAVTALQNAGFGSDNVIGVGLGAYLTCKDWKAGATTGNKAALFISGKSVGETAVKEMVAYLRDGTPLPPETIAPTEIVDADNWQSAGVECT